MSGLDPRPFDLAQGRGEESRTTIKTLGRDDIGIEPQPFLETLWLAADVARR
jgi:hypothetical protein